MKTTWTEKSEALIHATRYEIEKIRGLYVCYRIRRGPVDCYSRTMHNNAYEIGRAANLDAAKCLCEEHEKDNRQEAE